MPQTLVYNGGHLQGKKIKEQQDSIGHLCEWCVLLTRLPRQHEESRCYAPADLERQPKPYSRTPGFFIELYFRIFSACHADATLLPH
jgi:hypothetical protein